MLKESETERIPQKGTLTTLRRDGGLSVVMKSSAGGCRGEYAEAMARRPDDGVFIVRSIDSHTCTYSGACSRAGGCNFKEIKFLKVSVEPPG